MNGRAIRLAVIVALVLGMAVPGHALPSWQSVFDRVAPSVVRLEILNSDFTPAGLCSAFSVNEDKAYFVTAAHCYGPVLVVGSHYATMLYFSESLDLMVLSIPGVPRKAIRAGKQAVNGQDIAAIGYAEGLELAIRTGSVQRADHLRTLCIGDMFGCTPITARFMETDFALIGGQSGGPMVDRNGRLVSVNQAGNGIMALGRPLSVILAAVGSYFE